MKVTKIIPLDQGYARGQEVVETEDGVSHTCSIGGYHVGDEYPQGNKALRYNDNKPDWSLIHFSSLEPMVRVLEYGEKKYTVGDVSGRDNWKKPMPKMQILNSLMRHLVCLMEGEELDKESGLPHIGHLMCNALFYSYHSKHVQ